MGCNGEAKRRRVSDVAGPHLECDPNAAAAISKRCLSGILFQIGGGLALNFQHECIGCHIAGVGGISQRFSAGTKYVRKGSERE